MTFIVETGAGTPNATAYANPAYVSGYLVDRARETENRWSVQPLARQQEACIVGTSYIDMRFGQLFKGTRLQTNLPARAASGTLVLTLLPVINQTLTVGAKVYRLVDALAQENDVKRGTTVAESIANLQAAINGTDSGENVHANTMPNFEALAATDTDGNLLVACQMNGTNGNLVAFATNIGGATVTGATLTGGVDGGVQPLAFPRLGLYGYDGRVIVGVPDKLRQAMAEYAVRSLDAPLAPDPTTDATGALVQRKREKVGPIEEETEYAQGAAIQIFRPYPAADRLLAEYLRQGGGAYR